MQTFLPYPDFQASARSLDNRRLGKQRVEALQILNALKGQSGWRHHPAVKMWRGHEQALVAYAVAVCDEWRSRGFRDTCREKLLAAVGLQEAPGQRSLAASARLPSWLGQPAFHRSHQSNLIRKLPEHYGPQFPGVPSDLPYVWPEVGQAARQAA